MVDAYLVLITCLAFAFFLIYLLLDLFKTKNGLNGFYNKWTKKTIWIWLPFYALQRLIKEVLLGKK